MEFMVIDNRWREALNRPQGLVAFRGWNDGGEAASMAIHHLLDAYPSTHIGTLDHEEFTDYQVTRPEVIMDGGSHHILWPQTDVHQVELPGRDLVVVIGDEPRLRWRTYCLEIGKMFGFLGVDQVVCMGAFVGQVAHTLPVPIIGVAPPDVRVRHGLLSSNYTGPTGILSVLNDDLGQSGFDSVSLWAAIPHYLATIENPQAAQELLSRSFDVLGRDGSTPDLGARVQEWREDVSDLISESEELQHYISGLEQSGSLDPDGADELVEDIEAFLRDSES